MWRLRQCGVQGSGRGEEASRCAALSAGGQEAAGEDSRFRIRKRRLFVLQQPRRHTATRFTGAAACAFLGQQSATKAGGPGSRSRNKKGLHGSPRGVADADRKARQPRADLPNKLFSGARHHSLLFLPFFVRRDSAFVLLLRLFYLSILHSVQSQRKAFSVWGDLVRLRGNCPGNLLDGDWAER